MTSPLNQKSKQQVSDNNSELNIIDISQTNSNNNINIDENMTIYQSEIIKSQNEEKLIEYNMDRSSITDKNTSKKENKANAILNYASYILAIGISIGIGIVIYKRNKK